MSDKHLATSQAVSWARTQWSLHPSTVKGSVRRTSLRPTDKRESESHFLDFLCFKEDPWKALSEERHGVCDLFFYQGYCGVRGNGRSMSLKQAMGGAG